MLISWISSDPDQESFTEITNWWIGLKGQKIKWVQCTGAFTDSATGQSKSKMEISEVFTILNPALQNTNLTFQATNGLSGDFQIPPMNAQVKELRLDTQRGQLDVNCTTGEYHKFICQHSGGIFISEENRL